MKQIIALFSELYIRLCLIRKHFSCKKSQIIWSSIKTSRSNTCHLEGCYLSLSDINISDQQNSVILRGGRIYRCSIIIEGTNNSLYIDNDCQIFNSHIRIRGENCRIIIKHHTSVGNAQIICMGKNTNINIGSCCMIADNVDIWNTDSHPIYDKASEQLINSSRTINIGDKVWIGKGVAVLKGVTLGDGSVIGMHSVVTNNTEPYCIYAGNPAKKIRNDVYWDRSYIRE